MFQTYKEIFFGFAFGIGAVIIDTALDAIAEGNSFSDEVTAHPAMMLYRAGFLVLGLALGWLLWQRNAREREFRRLTETLQELQQKYGAQTLVLASKLQTLLTRDDLHLSDEARRLLHEAYEMSQEFQRMTDSWPAARTT